MSEYTPTTGDVRAAYNQLITATRPHELTHDYPCPEFDRWLTEHEAKVRDDYRDRLVDALRDFNRELDVTDPFNNGFVTGVEQLIKVLDSVKERAGKSFPIIRGGN